MARLFSWLLNIVYLGVLVLCSPLILWTAIRQGKYREGYAEKLLGHVPKRMGKGPCLWIHAVSVGEVNLLETTIRLFQSEHPDWEVVLSTTTKTGYDLARRKYGNLSLFYCPLDFSWAVRAAMRRIRPTMLVLAELELWPNLITAAKAHQAQVAIVNGRLSDKSFRGYRRIGPLVSRLLHKIDLLAVQDSETAKRFHALGARPESVHVTGSLKYDGAETDRKNPKTTKLRELARFSSDDIVFLAGSTQEPEEQIALDLTRRLSKEYPKLRLVLVPRHPERFDEVAKMLDAANVSWQRRSDLSKSAPNHSQGSRILLVDTIGELSAWWGTASIAFVGGSFGNRGGQNMLEPAAYGAAVSFGPNTWNFRDIVAALLAADGAIVVQDPQELETFVRSCLEKPEVAASLGARAEAFVASQLGATHRTVELLGSIRPPSPLCRSAA